jgi:hypothetical protein
MSLADWSRITLTEFSRQARTNKTSKKAPRFELRSNRLDAWLRGQLYTEPKNGKAYRFHPEFPDATRIVSNKTSQGGIFQTNERRRSTANAANPMDASGGRRALKNTMCLKNMIELLLQTTTIFYTVRIICCCRLLFQASQLLHPSTRHKTNPP